MKLCKACQQQNRTSGVYCGAVCKERFQTQKKIEQEKTIKRESLLFRAMVKHEIIFNGLPVHNKPTYGEVIDSLILRVYATSQKDNNFQGYWHPSASNPIIVTLDHIKKKIGNQQIESYYCSKLKDTVVYDDCNIIQYLWLVIVADFLYRHFDDAHFHSRSHYMNARMKGCIPETKVKAGSSLYESSDKRQITENIYGKVKGIVPIGCSLNGVVLGFEEQSKEHTFAVGETFYADVQRCPFSITKLNEYSVFEAQDISYEFPLMIDLDIPSTLVSEKVTNTIDAYGPKRAFGSIPLHWLTHYCNTKNKFVEWKPVSDWETLANQIVESIFDSLAV